MDITALSMSLTQLNTKSQVGTAVLSKTMDSNEALGEGLVQMMNASSMERSVNPTIGGNFDFKI